MNGSGAFRVPELPSGANPPPWYSEAVTLRESGLNYTSVAKRLGLTPNDVKRWLKPSRSQIKQGVRRRDPRKALFSSGQPNCQMCSSRGAHHEHHVVYEQTVRREGGDACDSRNALRLCVDCHALHHARAHGKVVPVSRLRAVNIDFAFELLGSGAYDYLRRKYDHDDGRLDLALQQRETDDRVSA